MPQDNEIRPQKPEGDTTVGLQNGIFTYRIPDTDLAHGSSLGNAHAWAASKATGALESLFNTDIGRKVTGSLVVNIFAPYRDLLLYSRREAELHEMGADTIVRLTTTGPGTFTIHPAYQEHSYSLINDIHVTETFFLPNTGFDDPAAAIQIIDIENLSTWEQSLAVIGCLYLPGDTNKDIQTRFDRGLGAVIAWNQDNPDWVRAFASLPDPDAYLVTHDIEEAWNPRYPLPNKNDETGEVVASLQLSIFLRPGEKKRFAFIVAFTPDGQKKIGSVIKYASDYEKLLQKTINRYEKVLKTADVMTPDTIINQGAQWCKANMLRVLANYPTGIAFTNDPGISSNVVIRDAAWFVFGSDFMIPEASCDLLHEAAKRQHDSGLIIEYYDARTGGSEDYGLNINDNTPLFILAAAHHVEATGHRSCLRNLYPVMVKAAEYIISQEDERGLVFCSARGTGAYGIAGWRNIIPGRSINGAVTEINAECYAALAAIARICKMAGESEKADRFAQEAENLRKAINEHLKNPANGMYYLNIDVDGNTITEVTADEIFPMIFGVSDEDTSQRITMRLSNPDFMTSAGLRTVSRLNPLFTPDRLIGLQGGVWPGVTWWYAMASVQSDPSVMVESLERSYRQYIISPASFNTVPGQFSEWFDGETLVNRGMRLSPWEPPRFLWAMIEGAVGLNVRGCQAEVKPRIPRKWNWLRVRNLHTSIGTISFFAARIGERLLFYTASGFMKAENTELYDSDLTELITPISADIIAAAYGRGDEIIACFGDTSGEKKPAPFNAAQMLDNARRYSVQVYQSEIGQWVDLGRHSGGSLSRLSIEIEPYGFVLFKFGQ